MLRGPDLVLLLTYFGLMGVVSWWVSSRHQNNSAEDFLLGHRDLPWWAVMLSILGSEISALTFVGVPASAYTGNWTYLQLVTGAILARIIVGRYFVKAFYQHRVTSIYEFLQLRFGPRTRTLAALVFLVTRILMSGVRLYAGAILAKVALGVSTPIAVMLIAGLGLLYTLSGGITAVIWIEVLQVAVMFLGSLVVLSVLGLPQLSAKTQILDWRTDPNLEFTVWSGLIGNAFACVAIFGTDYDMVQRMLTAKDSARSQLAVVVSGLANVPVSLLFLAIGTGLYNYYQLNPDPNLPSQAKDIFPFFIFTCLPAGVAGLVTAAVLSVVLSSFQSALNALAGSFVIDLYRPWAARAEKSASDADGKDEVSLLKGAMLACTICLVATAIPCEQFSKILNVGLEVGTYFYGSLLAVFTVGLFTTRGTDNSCLLAMVASIVSVLLLKATTHLAFPWFVCCGWLIGFAVAASARAGGGTQEGC